MKKTLLLIIVFFALTDLAQAQVTVEFNYPKDTIWVNDDSTQNDAYTIKYVTNTGNAKLDLVWVRVNVDIPNGWETAICDKRLCWGVETDTAYFSLEPAEEGEVYPHFYPNMITGKGCLTLKVYEEENPTNVDSLVYCAKIRPIGIDEVKLEDIKVYPNPAKTTMTISLPETISGGTIEIYDMLGNKVIIDNVSGNETEVNVADLPVGKYVLRFIDQNGTAYNKRFQKVN